MRVQRRIARVDVVSVVMVLLFVLISCSSSIAQDLDTSKQAQRLEASTARVPGDRWMEIDLYWFDQAEMSGSVRSFWDRFAPMYKDVRGNRGVILNVGWTVGYIMEWSGDAEQRISLPAGTGEQPWVKESAPLAGTTEQRRVEWKQRFANPSIVARAGYGPWTYADLRRLTDAIRLEAAKRGITNFKVGSLAYAWDDAYGEIAPWAKRHPEAFSTWQFTRDGQKQSGKFFDAANVLHHDASQLGDCPMESRKGCRFIRHSRRSGAVSPGRLDWMQSSFVIPSACLSRIRERARMACLSHLLKPSASGRRRPPRWFVRPSAPTQVHLS